MKFIFLLAIVSGKNTEEEQFLWEKNKRQIEKFLTKTRDVRIASLDQKMTVMRKFINWDEKGIQPYIEPPLIRPPWVLPIWNLLRPNQRWTRVKKYEKKLRKNDRLRKEHANRLAKDELEKQIFEEKYSNLYLERGKKVSWNFAVTYSKMRIEGWRAEKAWAEFNEKKNIASPKKPHIVFIMSDDLGYADVGFEGERKLHIATPNMDMLAANGIRLNSSYTQPVCTPSRAQFLTGRYSSRIGLQHMNISPPQPSGIPLDEVLFPELLGNCGYNTQIVGKWHLGMYSQAHLPQNRGFDHFIGLHGGNANYWSHVNCFEPPKNYTDKFRWCGYDMNESKDNGGYKIRHDLNGTHSNEVFVSEFDKRLKFLGPEKPSFTYIALQSVHNPITPQQSFLDMYVNEYSQLENYKRTKMIAQGASLDHAIGQIILKLKKRGFWENTILIFSNDNGGGLYSSNYPLKGHKGGFEEGGIRTHSIVYSPLMDKTSHGTVSNSLFDVTDWFPTILDFAGCDAKGKKPLDGVSQKNFLWNGGQSEAPRTEILQGMDKLRSIPENFVDPKVYEVLKNRTFKTRMHGVIRWNQWKLITGPFATKYKRIKAEDELKRNDNAESDEWHQIEKRNVNAFYTNITKFVILHDIGNDPEEYHEISYKFPEVVDIMLVKLADYFDDAVPARFPAFDMDANPEFNNWHWGPWIKTASERGFGDFANKTAAMHYNTDLYKKLNTVDQSLIEISNRNIFEPFFELGE